MKTRRAAAGAAVAVLALGAGVLGACSKDSSTSTGAGTTAGTQAPSASVTVANPWARASAAGQTLGAVYMDLTATTDDALVKASVPSSVAKTVELHETTMSNSTGTTMKPSTGSSMKESTGSSMEGMKSGFGGFPAHEGEEETTQGTTMGTTMGTTTGTAMSGEMSMKPVSSIALPAGKTVSLKPGGYHIMLIDLAAPLTEGQTIAVTLTFEKAPPQTVNATVKSA